MSTWLDMRNQRSRLGLEPADREQKEQERKPMAEQPLFEKIFRHWFKVIAGDPHLAASLQKPMHWPHTQEAYRVLARLAVEVLEQEGSKDG